MGCIYVTNSTCSCGNTKGCRGCLCPKLIPSTALTLNGSSLIVTIPQNKYANDEVYCLNIAQAIPSGVTSSTQVVIQIGTNGPYSMTTKCGHLVYGDQIKSGCTYCVRVATDTKSFVYCGKRCLPKTGFIFTASLP